MKDILPKQLVSTLIYLLLIYTVAGIVLSFIINEFMTVFIVFLLVFIMTCILLYRFYFDYIKPVEKASDTIKDIGQGNYKARYYYTKNDTMLELSNQINRLARNLTDYSLQEEMQSEQLSTLIDNTESGLVLLDEKGYIHLVNPKFTEMFGGLESDYIGSIYYNAIKNDVFLDAIKRVFIYEKNITETIEHYIGINKLFLEITGAPIVNEQSILKGAVLVVHDITEFKKLENMRKDFVANVSHELRTPITSIKGFSETLLDGDLEDKDVLKEFLQIIYNESYRLQVLIEDLLALSKLESDTFQLVLHKVNARDLIDALAMALEFKADEKNISLTIDVDDSLEFLADKDRITQVIINLISNAMNYTGENGHVTLRIIEEADKVVIIVSDTGIGVPEEELPRIFERFYRIEKARTRDSGGTGLGLAIVKHIVEVHNGKIEVESKVNEGTTIKVFLPK